MHLRGWWSERQTHLSGLHGLSPTRYVTTQQERPGMKERPILFSGAMVRAILDGRKTQTRRIGKWQMDAATGLGVEYSMHATKGCVAVATYLAYPNRGTARWGLCECPFGIPGDRLWVKETFQPIQLASEVTQWRYAATDKKGLANWKPSIFMPRKASRITLEITNIRVDRIAAISIRDCLAEGVHSAGRDNDDVRAAYRKLWDDINFKRGFGWNTNPWVWVIEFKIVWHKAERERPGMNQINNDLADGLNL